MDKENLKLEDVTSALLGFHQWKKASNEISQGEGLVVRGTIECGKNKSQNGLGNNRTRTKSRKKEITYYKCKIKENIKQYYPEKKKGNAANKDGSLKSII